MSHEHCIDTEQNKKARIELLLAQRLYYVRIPLMADSDSISIADSVPGDGGHVARVS